MNTFNTITQTLCFFQAFLNDLALRRDTQSFGICSRVLQAVTHIIFSDPSTQRRRGSDTLMPIIPKRKVKAHVEPALVGLGTILASCPGLPILAQIVGEAAIEQGRYSDPRVFTTGPTRSEEAAIPASVSKEDTPPRSDTASDASENELTDAELSEAEQDVEAYGRALIAARDAAVQSGLTPPIEPPPSPSLQRRNVVSSTEQSKRLRKPPSHRRTTGSRPHSHSSSPSLSHAPSIDTMSTRHSAAFQSRLLRSHYLHSEVQFLQTLSAIS
jgi:phosphatidylinositol 4-kinase B